MSAHSLEERIKNMIIQRLFLEASPDEIGDEDDLMKKFDLDSIRLFEITIGLESEFNIDLSEVEFDLDNFTTVAKLAAIVNRLKG